MGAMENARRWGKLAQNVSITAVIENVVIGAAGEAGSAGAKRAAGAVGAGAKMSAGGGKRPRASPRKSQQRE